MIHRQTKVLVAPLDWGLGHATRCIPVIRELQNLGVEVVLCASGGGKIILQKEFPGCLILDLPGITVSYPAKGSMVISMLAQMPSMLKDIRREHVLLNKIIEQHQITHVISDNRFGLYSGKVKTAIITHQVKIKSHRHLKFLEPVLFMINRFYIEKFNQLWIPDLPPPGNLSGELSNAEKIRNTIRYIGILSRFNAKHEPAGKTYDYIALLSGPEPQRTLLEIKLLDFFRNSGKKWLLIQGLPGEHKHHEDSVKSSISDDELTRMLHPDTLLFCRPGYSTIMDLAVLGHKRVLFIPTPGQTEQEYLAKYFFHTYGVRYIHQEDEIPALESISPAAIPDFTGSDSLSIAIRQFLEE